MFRAKVVKLFNNDEAKLPFVGRALIYHRQGNVWTQEYSLHGGQAVSEIEKIKAAMRTFGESYLGAHDIYKFKLQNGETRELVSIVPYEEIWSLYQKRGGSIKDGWIAWGFKYNPKDQEYNKSVMIMSMLLSIQNDGSFGGTGDPEVDMRLTHDYALYLLSRINQRKKIGETLSIIKKQIERYKLPPKSVPFIQEIISSYESIT